MGLLFRGHWLVQMVLAALCFAAAGWVWQDVQRREADKVLALQQGLPEPVALGHFDPARHIHPADEVHVIGWIDPAHNYRLTEERKGKRSSYDVVRRMFVLFGPADAPGSREARAVLLMTEPQFEGFAAALPGLIVDPAAAFPTLRVNGSAETAPTLKGMAEDALAERGLRKAPGFVFIEPWAGGRDRALAPDTTTAPILAGGLAALGGFLALLAVLKMRRGGRSQAQLAEAAKLQSAMRLHYAAQGLPVPEPAAAPAVAARPKRRVPVWLLLAAGAVVALATVPGLGRYAGLLAPLAMLGIFLLGLRQAKRMAAAGAGVLWSRAAAAVAAPPAPVQPPSPPPSALAFTRPDPGAAALRAAAAAPPVHEPAIRSAGGGQPGARLVLAMVAGLALLAMAGGWSPQATFGFLSDRAAAPAAPAAPQSPARIALAEPAAARPAEALPAPRQTAEPVPAEEPPARGIGDAAPAPGLPGLLAGALTEIGIALLVLGLIGFSVRRWVAPAAPRLAGHGVDPFDRLAERRRAGERC